MLTDTACKPSADSQDLNKSRSDLISAKEYTDNVLKSMIDTLIVVSPDLKIETLNKAIHGIKDLFINQMVGFFIQWHMEGNKVSSADEVVKFNTIYI